MVIKHSRKLRIQRICLRVRETSKVSTTVYQMRIMESKTKNILREPSKLTIYQITSKMRNQTICSNQRQASPVWPEKLFVLKITPKLSFKKRPLAKIVEVNRTWSVWRTNWVLNGIKAKIMPTNINKEFINPIKIQAKEP